MINMIMRTMKMRLPMVDKDYDKDDCAGDDDDDDRDVNCKFISYI